VEDRIRKDSAIPSELEWMPLGSLSRFLFKTHRVMRIYEP
jgi:hypothetical protein